MGFAVGSTHPTMLLASAALRQPPTFFPACLRGAAAFFARPASTCTFFRHPNNPVPSPNTLSLRKPMLLESDKPMLPVRVHTATRRDDNGASSLPTNPLRRTTSRTTH